MGWVEVHSLVEGGVFIRKGLGGGARREGGICEEREGVYCYGVEWCCNEFVTKTVKYLIIIFIVCPIFDVENWSS